MQWTKEFGGKKKTLKIMQSFDTIFNSHHPTLLLKLGVFPC